MLFSRGSPACKFYIVMLHPTDVDLQAGELLSGAAGYEISKWGIPRESYTMSIFPTAATASASISPEYRQYLEDFTQKLRVNAPAVILALGDETLAFLCPETVRKGAGSLARYAGSILTTPYASSPHYVIGTYSPEELWRNWEERPIVKTIDAARAVEEFAYYTAHGTLQPLPTYTLKVDLDFDTLLTELRSFRSTNLLSNDIETIRPRKAAFADSDIENGYHPGLVYTQGLAPTRDYGISFCLWDYSDKELVTLYRELDFLFTHVPQLGQNFFNFDAKFLQAQGFTLCLDRCCDTRINHHILWPSLSHSLQFMTRQYTRQPYYKDEGKGWLPKNEKLKRRLKQYNAMDCCVTMAVYEEQAVELTERGLL